LNWIDAVIAGLLFIGFVHGVMKGAIQEIFVVLALVLGVIIAGRVASGTEDITSQLSHPLGAKVFVFALTFLVAAIVIGLFGKMFSGLAKAANLRMIDRFLGGIVGACLIGIAVGIILSIAKRLGMDLLAFEESFLARQLIQAVNVLAGFLPKASETVETARLWL
jgi:uncharacterized membrane protein required for colicin V production